ncbi:MAG: hypothetical protein ACE5G1_01370, partial [bacterium]
DGSGIEVVAKIFGNQLAVGENVFSNDISYSFCGAWICAVGELAIKFIKGYFSVAISSGCIYSFEACFSKRNYEVSVTISK